MLKKLIRISRPHIWIYTAGSYITGVLLGYRHIYDGFSLFQAEPFKVIGLAISHISSHTDLLVLLYTGLWLTVGANVFLYAQNDAHDIETDLLNPKKDSFEERAEISDKKKLLLYSLYAYLLYVPCLFILEKELIILFLVWTLIVLTYNFKPFRFKAIPILDCIFAFNFPLWGIFGYTLVTNSLPSIITIVILFIFAIVSHIYTASGDIEYDKKDSIITTSVFIGNLSRNIYACIFGMLLLFYMSLTYFTPILHTALAPVYSIYILFFALQLINIYRPYTHRDNNIWYKWYIYIHYISGFIFMSLYF